MVIRFILLAVVLWLLFSAIHRYIRLRKQREKKDLSGRHINMVACSRCGVHLPQSEAIHKNNNYYCCKEHARLRSDVENPE